MSNDHGIVAVRAQSLKWICCQNRRQALRIEKAPAEASALSGAYLSLLTAGLRFLNSCILARLQP